MLIRAWHATTKTGDGCGRVLISQVDEKATHLSLLTYLNVALIVIDLLLQDGDVALQFLVSFEQTTAEFSRQLKIYNGRRVTEDRAVLSLARSEGETFVVIIGSGDC